MDDDQPTVCTHCDGDHEDDECTRCAFPLECAESFGHLRSDCATTDD